MRSLRLLCGVAAGACATAATGAAAWALAGAGGDDPGRWLAAAAVAGAAAVPLQRVGAAVRRRALRLRALTPAQFRLAVAVAEVLVPEPGRSLSPREIATNIDAFLADFRGRGRWKLQLALTALLVYPLLVGRPPLPLLPLRRRMRFVERHFVHGVAERRIPEPLRTLTQMLVRAAQQLVYIGYYGDARTHAEVGFTRFRERPEAPARLREARLGRGLVVSAPAQLDRVHEADVVVVGSGAAGATAAYRLAERGRRVLVLERGPHVDPARFTDGEVAQFSALYGDGALQVSRDGRFAVLQGMCVGGSTVVNNAVCFDLPRDALGRWNDPAGADAGIDPDELADTQAELRRWFPIVRLAPDSPVLNPGGRPFEQGVRALGLEEQGARFGTVDVNMSGCLGCGACNLGCPYGKKLSMLDHTLPRAQAEFGYEAVQVVADADVRGIESDGPRATAVRVRLADGRTVRVRARTVVLAAGAIASSLLLRRSRIGGRRPGRGVAFNMGSPVTAEFDEPIRGHAGLQISHYLEPSREAGYVLETWFNPAMSQSLFMPGWFGAHAENMRRYAHMACGGVVVGTRGRARVGRGIDGGVDLAFRPAPEDMARLVDGMILMGRIWLAAGAERVMPATHRYIECRSPRDLDRLRDLIRDSSDVSVNSAHPQGGNAISRDPRRGVVGPDFRVHGYDNLYLCDASVFPSSITVNPQLTVMALATMAARAAA